MFFHFHKWKALRLKKWSFDRMIDGICMVTVVTFKCKTCRKLKSKTLNGDFELSDFEQGYKMHLFHRFKVISRRKVAAEGRYPMTYVDRRCRCGEYKGIYI